MTNEERILIVAIRAVEESIRHGYREQHLSHCSQETCTCGLTDLCKARDELESLELLP